jgi:hypothetical protein
MQKQFVLGTLAVTGALVGCGGGSPNRKNTSASTTAPITTAPVTTQTPPSTLPPAITPPASSTVSKGPKVTSVTPSNGPLAGGTAVKIFGSGFNAAGAGKTLVLFGANGVFATPVSDSEMRVNVAPSTSAGTVEVRVVNDNGTAVLASGFAYDRNPRFTFSPEVGHEEAGQGGTRITLALTDHSLLALPKVKFGAVDATKVALIDSSTITAEVPAGLTAGKSTITIEDGATKITANDFLVQAPLNYGDLIVNEFCANPSGQDTNLDGARSSTADEFVEIVNCTKDPVDLSYLTLRDATGETHRFPNPTTLQPGKAIVVFGGGTPRDLLAQSQQSGAGGLNLTNDDTIEIRTLPGTSGTGVGTTIYRVDFKAAPAAVSMTNPVDGARITKNPATSADYVDHSKAQGSKSSFSPGAKADGSKF